MYSSKAKRSTLRDVSVDNTSQQLKAARGHLYAVHVQNPNASDAWLQLYDATTANVTVGTTTPKLSFVVPANGAFDREWGDDGLEFETAITYAATTGANNGTNPATALVAGFEYR